MAPEGSLQLPSSSSTNSKNNAVDQKSCPPPTCMLPGRRSTTTRQYSRIGSRHRSAATRLLRSMEHDDIDNDGEPLTIELVAEGLDRIALVGFQAALNFTRLSLARCNISDISVLAQFPYLQELDLPFNKIEDISPIRNLRYLTVLNFENNHIRKIQFLTLSPSLTSFRRFNFADNNISQLPKFAGYLSLLYLNMHANELTNIDGLASARYVRYVDVSDNNIRTLNGLESAEHLTYFDISGNRVRRLGALQHFKDLQTLKIARNRLTDLAGVQDLVSLRMLDASDNRIQQLESLLHLVRVRFLSQLNLKSNPIVRRAGFLPMVYYLCSNLTWLNGAACTDAQWLEAKEMFLVNPLIRGVRDHFRDMAMKISSCQLGGKVLAQTAELSDQTFTIIFLMGPPGGGRETLATRLGGQCPHLVRLVRTVTARIESEKLTEILLPGNDAVYEQISEIEYRKLVRNNELLLSYGRRGCLYGIRECDVDDAARQNLAVVACIDTAGVTDLIGSNVRPLTFYVYPHTPRIMRARIEECGYDDVNTKRALNGLHYSETLREKFPDFFHGKIDSDNLDLAWEFLLEQLAAAGLRINDAPGAWKWTRKKSSTSEPASTAETTPSNAAEVGEQTMASILNKDNARYSTPALADKHWPDFQAINDMQNLLPQMLPHHLRRVFNDTGYQTNNVHDSKTRTHRASGSDSDKSSSNLGEVYFKRPLTETKTPSSQHLSAATDFDASWERRIEKSFLDEIHNADGLFEIDSAEEMQHVAEPNTARWTSKKRRRPKHIHSVSLNKQQSRKQFVKTNTGSTSKLGTNDGTQRLNGTAHIVDDKLRRTSMLPSVTTDDTPYVNLIDMTTAITGKPDLIFDESTADAALFARNKNQRPASCTASWKSNINKNKIIPIGRNIAVQMLPRLAQRQLERTDFEIRQIVQREVRMKRESPTFENEALQQLPDLRSSQRLSCNSNQENQPQLQNITEKSSRFIQENVSAETNFERQDDIYRKFDTYREWITAWRRAVSKSKRQRKNASERQRRKQLESSDKPSPVALAAMMGELHVEKPQQNIEIAHLEGVELAGALPREKQDVFSLERQKQFLARQNMPIACKDMACVHTKSSKYYKKNSAQNNDGNPVSESPSSSGLDGNSGA